MFNRKPKYNAVHTIVDGIKFDSKREANRYLVLKAMEESGEIRALRRQVKFTLIVGEKWTDGKKHRDTVYIADFVYYTKTGMVVEDVKGFKTPVYRIKKELMKAVHHIEVKEV